MNRIVQVKDVAEINLATYKKDDFPTDIKYLDTSSLTKNKIEHFQFLNIYTDVIPSRAQRKIKQNTILYSTVRPNQEHYGIIEKLQDDIVVSTGFTTLDVIDNEINPKYLFYLLTQPHITEYLHTIATNSVSAYPSISPNDLGNLKFRVPELTTQQKIASVLSALDSKIELNNRINAELEAMAKTLYDYWFVQFDFPDKNGKPYKTSVGKMVWNEELKREIPEGWEVKEIGEIAIVKAGGDKPENYSIKKTETNNVPIYSNGITNDGLYGYTSKSIINEQSITISARGTIGFCVLRNKPFVPIIRLISLIPNLKGSAKYFYEALKNFIFENSGSVQSQLTVPQVTRIKIIYPNEDILIKYGEVTSPMIERIEIIQKENQKLTELRDWLLPMLMNGQVKVSER
jgi:type I restriction enzyme S subunit